MRRILAVSLLLSPILFPAAVNASAPVDDSSAKTQTVQRSTGVTEARLLQQPKISLAPSVVGTLAPTAELVLKLNIDEQGKPEDIQVVRSVSQQFDERVIEAVRKLQWQPATLDHQAVPVDMTLNVEVKR
jgi:TonB family protein